MERREDACQNAASTATVGLSVGKIISVDWGEEVTRGIDLVDGTPVLDIKPYVPWCDSVTEATAPKWVTRAIEGEGERWRLEVKFAAPEDGTREKVRGVHGANRFRKAGRNKDLCMKTQTILWRS